MNTKSGKPSVAKSLAPGTTPFQNRPEGAKPLMTAVLNRRLTDASRERGSWSQPVSFLHNQVGTAGQIQPLLSVFSDTSLGTRRPARVSFLSLGWTQQRVCAGDTALSSAWMHNNHQTGIALHVLYPNPCGFPGKICSSPQSPPHHPLSQVPPSSELCPLPMGPPFLHYISPNPKVAHAPLARFSAG